MNCRYYTEKTLGWMLNNKLIVFLGLLSFCLFVSTLALAGQKNRLISELDELKAATTTSPDETTNGTEIPTTTEALETEVTETTTEAGTDQGVTNAGDSPSNPDETNGGANPPGNDQEPTPISTAGDSRLLKMLGYLA